jgi:D-sedoheptulose 7-phosphate isomerase
MQRAIAHRAQVIGDAMARDGLAAQVVQVADTITRAGESGHTVYAFGNGGNAANAEQLVTELIGRYAFDRGPVPAATLTAAGPFTAINNDYGYENGYARQIQALAKPGDVVVGYSTSGESPNVNEALRAANEIGATTVAFSGETGSMKDLVDLPIVVASTFTATIEEAHLILTHLICDRVERVLFADTGVRIRTPEPMDEGGDA